MLDQDPDALIAIAEKMDAEDFAVAPMPLGPAGKSFPTIGYAGWGDVRGIRAQGRGIRADRPSFVAREQSGVGEVRRRHPDPSGRGAGSGVYRRGSSPDWFTEMNDDRWKPTVMPTYLEEFAYFADVMVVQGGQELLLGQRTAEDVANEWAAYLTDAQKKWLDAQ